jgi:hypothetical protein
MILDAPFPWFGGKRMIAHEIWNRFTGIQNYVEPFFGSGAVLLNRPEPFDGIETINDYDGLVSNFWRSIKYRPDETAEWADNPVNECVPIGTIATPSGPIPAEAVRPGMIVYGEHSGVIVPTRVIATTQGESSEFYRIGPLRVTPNHPVWTQEQGYIKADQLVVGLHVRTFGQDRAGGVATLGNLFLERPARRRRSLCGNYVQAHTATNRTYFESDQRRQNTQRQLDPIFDQCEIASGIQNTGEGTRQCVVTTRAVLDRFAWSKGSKPNEPDRRRRRNARLCAEPGLAPKMVRATSRDQISRGTAAGDVRQESFTGSGREDQAYQPWAQDAGINENQDFCGPERQATVARACGEIIGHPSWQTTFRGVAAENLDSYHHSATRRVHRDGGDICVSNSRSHNSRSGQVFDLSSDSQRLPLQRQSLSKSVVTYNFQTDTGNYFADGILVHNCDLHARHIWLLQYRDTLRPRLEADPEWCDPQIAGWWCWGICCWIGSGFCSGQGPWRIVDGQLQRVGANGHGIWRERPHLGNAGQGIKRGRPHLGGAGQYGQGINAKDATIYAWFAALSARLRRVRVCCGDWSRVCGPSPTFKHGITGVFLDPPYGAEANRDNNLYRCDSTTLAREVREWAIEVGKRNDMLVALCGYEGEHEMPASWTKIAWKAHGGYAWLGDGSGKDNAHRERVWFSPACMANQGEMF